METEKNLISLAGEMRVCSELLKRGLSASITFGNAKATDIIVTGRNNRFIRVEVKTSKNGKNFVTNYYPKYTDANSLHPDIWVFYLPCLPDKNLKLSNDRFFIATHEDVGKLQRDVNTNGGTKPGDGITLPGKGCDNIPLKVFEKEKDRLEDKWELFENI